MPAAARPIIHPRKRQETLIVGRRGLNRFDPGSLEVAPTESAHAETVETEALSEMSLSDFPSRNWLTVPSLHSRVLASKLSSEQDWRFVVLVRGDWLPGR